MRDFSETLRRTLDAADCLIQAAKTGDPALRQRLTSMAQYLLGEAEGTVPGDAPLSIDGTSSCLKNANRQRWRGR